MCIKELEWETDIYPMEDIPEENELYFEELFRKVLGRRHERQKRQSNIRSWGWTRQEVRMLSPRQWRRFTNRVNFLKNSRVIHIYILNTKCFKEIGDLL